MAAGRIHVRTFCCKCDNRSYDVQSFGICLNKNYFLRVHNQVLAELWRCGNGTLLDRGDRHNRRVGTRDTADKIEADACIFQHCPDRLYRVGNRTGANFGLGPCRRDCAYLKSCDNERLPVFGGGCIHLQIEPLGYKRF